MNLEIEEIDIYISPIVPLDFEDWFFLNEESLIIEFAETGADREHCFDFEFEIEKRYQLYLEHFENKLLERVS